MFGYRPDGRPVPEYVDPIVQFTPFIMTTRNDAPVSYTHLDVYKRQALGHRLAAVRPRLCHHRQTDGLLSRPGAGGRRHRAEGGALPAQRGHRHLPGNDRCV